jgi:anhydro-N-acetylmuramic acid kinase
MADGMVTALGLMSGTSMDGIDVAVLRTDGRAVGAAGAWATFPYEDGLRRRLGESVAAGEGLGPTAVAALEAAITEAHAEAVEAFLSEAGMVAAQIGVVGFHGHTLFHRPERRLTRQLGDGAWLAARLGIDVVNDFRSADVAAGGQGAPLVPLYHAALARSLEQPLAVLNIGGVANVTWISGERVLAFDTGPGNALIDDWALAHTGRPWDEGGRLAATGRIDARRLALLLAHDYFDRPPPKSLDRNDFRADAVAGLSPADGAATLAAFTAASVARAREHFPQAPRRWLITGGGRRNPILMAMLSERLGVPVEPVEAVGWRGDALEAEAFAFLAVRSLAGLSISLPETTGAPRPMTGGVVHRAPHADASRRRA